MSLFVATASINFKTNNNGCFLHQNSESGLGKIAEPDAFKGRKNRKDRKTLSLLLLLYALYAL